MGTAFSGVNGDVTVNGTSMCVTGWDLEHKGEMKSNSTVCDGIWTSTGKVSETITGSFDVYVRSDKPIFRPGTEVSLSLAMPDGMPPFAGTGVIGAYKITSKKEDWVTLNIPFESKGTWTGPWV